MESSFSPSHLALFTFRFIALYVCGALSGCSISMHTLSFSSISSYSSAKSSIVSIKTRVSLDWICSSFFSGEIFEIINNASDV